MFKSGLRCVQRVFSTWYPENYFKDNREAVDSENLRLLYALALFVLWTFAFFAPCRFLLWKPSSPAAAVPHLLLFFVCAAVSAAMRFYAPGHRRCIMPCGYALIISLIVYGMIVSVFHSTDSPATSIIAILPLVPLIMLDRPKNVNILLCCSAAAFCALSLLNKSADNAAKDVINCVIFTCAALFVNFEVPRVRLHEMNSRRLLAEQAATDALTGLRNRWSLYVRIESCGRNGYETGGCVMLDIDFFKMYNDTYGHPAGDACLRSIGALLSQMAEESGMEAYRYGGEEFLVLAAPGGGAAAAAESIVKRVSELGIPFDASPFGKVTISAGYSARGNAAASLAALIKQADEALYKAKQSGRNRAAYA